LKVTHLFVRDRRDAVRLAQHAAMRSSLQRSLKSIVWFGAISRRTQSVRLNCPAARTVNLPPAAR